MPNGKEVISDLEFEKQIESKDDRKLLEFVARENYKQSKTMAVIAKDVAGNKKRSWQNRIALITLILVLISLGIIDWHILTAF